MTRPRMTETDAYFYLQRFYGNAQTKIDSAVPATDAKPDIPNALDPKAQAIQVAKRFCVRVTSCGRRLADTDGNSVKAILDGITAAGIWPDDSSKFIEEISFTQKAGEIDQTIIEIIEREYG